MGKKRIGLEILSRGEVVFRQPLEPGLTSLGSNPACDVCLPVQGVAAVQMLLRRRDNELTLVNRHPRGTRVNGESVLGERPLAHRDRVHLGALQARIRLISDEHDVDPEVRTRTLTPQGRKEGDPHLFVTIPELYPGRHWPLTEAGLHLGGDPTNDVVLDDPYVSGFHARLRLDGGRVVISDLGSRNGILVGERRVLEGEVPLGLQVRLGKTVVIATSQPPEGRRLAEPHGPRLLGVSAAMTKVRERVRRVAASDATVLLTGETGTGKEVVARLIAALSPRAGRPLVVINAGALVRTLVGSELFGHHRGAFTGADHAKEGAFDAADRGTLFLDEIGELPLELQPQLLRVLDSGEVKPLGCAASHRVDVRVLAATNRDLEQAVRKGGFRQDLFHRLHVLTIKLPPLRERQEDIALLAQHFIKELTPEGEAVALGPGVLTKLQEYAWPGNVRELYNTLQAALLLRSGDVLCAADIKPIPSTPQDRLQVANATISGTLAEVERAAIVAQLIRHRGNRKATAAALGLSRSTIHRRIVEYGIDVKALLDEADKLA